MAVEMEMGMGMGMGIWKCAKRRGAGSVVWDERAMCLSFLLGRGKGGGEGSGDGVRVVEGGGCEE